MTGGNNTNHKNDKIVKLIYFAIFVFIALLVLMGLVEAFAPPSYTTNIGKVINLIENGAPVYVYNDVIKVENYMLPLKSLPDLQKIATPGQINLMGTNSISAGTINLITWAMVLVVFIAFLLVRATSISVPAGFTSIKEKAASKIPKVSFDDVAGIDKIKDEINDILLFLKNPNKFKQMGARAPKGVLFAGPPGVGKTLIAKALAHEAKVPFFFASGSEFAEMYVGVGAARVRDLFAKARRHAPAIVFIDEIDTLGARRGPHSHSEDTKTLNQLLTEMDGVTESDAPIVVIAATNRPEILDPALLRPKRFDKIINIPLPDKRARKQILTVHLKNKPLADNIEEVVEKLASMTTGFSGADLENLCNEAALLAALEDSSVVTWKHFKIAYDKVTIGLDADRQLDEKTKKRVAYHEAGHAICAKGIDKKIDRISILPRSKALGFVRTREDEDKVLATFSELMGELVLLLGGRAAEELYCGEPSTGAQNDLERATKLAKKMLYSYGFKTLSVKEIQYSQYHSEKILDDIDEQVIENLLYYALELAKEHIKNNEEYYLRLVNLLYNKEDLEENDVNQFFEKYPIRAIMKEKLQWQHVMRQIEAIKNAS